LACPSVTTHLLPGTYLVTALIWADIPLQVARYPETNQLKMQPGESNEFSVQPWQHGHMLRGSPPNVTEKADSSNESIGFTLTQKFHFPSSFASILNYGIFASH
jgi:hypothetical protein